MNNDYIKIIIPTMKMGIRMQRAMGIIRPIIKPVKANLSLFLIPLRPKWIESGMPTTHNGRNGIKHNNPNISARFPFLPVSLFECKDAFNGLTTFLFTQETFIYRFL